MNVVEKIRNDEVSRLKANKDLDKIALKSFVSVQYLTGNKDKRIFRGIVIAKQKKGIHTSVTVVKTDSDPGKRLTYKFLLYSPNLIDIHVDRLCSKKPRRSKLYYMESRFGKSAKI